MTIESTLMIAGNIFAAMKGFLLIMSPIILAVAIWAYKRRLDAFPLEVIILEKRDKNLVKTNDRAGRVRIDGIYKYKFKKLKDTVPIVSYDWVVSSSHRPTNIFERFSNLLSRPSGTIFFYKYGSQQYKPVLIKVGDKTVKKLEPVKDKDGNLVYIDVYYQLDPKNEINVTEFITIDWDNINFMVQEQRATDERRRRKESLWQKLAVPIIIIGVAAIIFIVAIYFGSEIVKYAWSIMPNVNQPTAPPTEATTPSGLGDLIIP